LAEKNADANTIFKQRGVQVRKKVAIEPEVGRPEVVRVMGVTHEDETGTTIN